MGKLNTVRLREREGGTDAEKSWAELGNSTSDRGKGIVRTWW